jgi:hypothetical protein
MVNMTSVSVYKMKNKHPGPNFTNIIQNWQKEIKVQNTKKKKKKKTILSSK